MKKTVLITGASRGIGAACALYFAKQGFDVAINYFANDEAAQKVAQDVEKLGRRALLVKADVADYNAVSDMVEKVKQEFGVIDVLINNAAISKQAVFSDMSLEEEQRIFSVNVGGMLHCIRAVLPQMIHEKRGSIVNVSSIWGIQGASCEVQYSASKAAVIGATKALAQELAPSNIRVNCVAPGIIDTDMNKALSEEDLKNLKEETPLGVLGTPTDIAKSIYFLASDELSPFTTGQILSPNGGFVI